jgi:hypothetical protein
VSWDLTECSLVGCMQILEELAAFIFSVESNLHFHRGDNLKSHKLFVDGQSHPIPSPAVNTRLLRLRESFQILNFTRLYRIN